MNLKRFPLIVLGFLFALILLVGGGASDVQAQQNDPQDPPSGDPSVFTEDACNGNAAIVYQSTDETGDGVTLSLDDPWGCDPNAELFVVEPWGTTLNADSGCIAVPSVEKTAWEVVGDMADRLETQNGSVWVLPLESNVRDNPMVEDCSEVQSREQLGLNPNESQIAPDRLTWVFARATELREEANLTQAEYCWQYATDPLSLNLLCADWWEIFQQLIGNW